MFSSVLKKVWFLWLLCLLVNIITLLMVFFKIHDNSDKIIVLHYNVILGNDIFGKANSLYELPLAAFLITGVNYLLFYSARSSKTFYTPLTAGTSLLVQGVIFFATVLILKAGY